MKRNVPVLILLLAALLPALAANPKSRPDSLLPESFAGWQKGAPARTSVHPADADKINPDLLKECTF